MPSALTYPGVYIEEIPSGVRTITGVATSITAFVGRAQRGPVNRPVRVQSFAEFSRIFGGLWALSRMSYAVNQFFQHGGSRRADRAGVQRRPRGRTARRSRCTTDDGDLGSPRRAPGSGARACARRSTT